MQIQIRPLDANDDGDIESSFRIRAAVQTYDVPDFPAYSHSSHVGQLRHAWPGYEPHRFLASVDGADAGYLGLALPTLDNTHMAEVDVEVDPAYRRRGVGRALYTAAIDFARAKGRRILQGAYVSQLPDGPERDPGHAAFADAMGAKPALPEVRRRLDLTTVDRREWDRLGTEARAKAQGYSVLAWTDASPDEIVASLAALDSRFLAEAPIGDLELEPENVDVARIRASEDVGRKRGRKPYHVGLRHDASGVLAAWTTIVLDPDVPEAGWQMITIVDREHRGHRLGMLAKLENLDQTLTAEPQLRHIDTWNANENAHMIAINEAIGFRAVDQWVSWQQEI